MENLHTFFKMAAFESNFLWFLAWIDTDSFKYPHCCIKIEGFVHDKFSSGVREVNYLENCECKSIYKWGTWTSCEVMIWTQWYCLKCVMHFDRLQFDNDPELLYSSHHFCTKLWAFQTKAVPLTSATTFSLAWQAVIQILQG